MASEGRVGRVEHGLVDDANDGDAANTECDRYAEHREEMRVVHGAVQGVNNPCGRVVDEVILGLAGAIGFFSDEPRRTLTFASLYSRWY